MRCRTGELLAAACVLLIRGASTSVPGAELLLVRGASEVAVAWVKGPVCRDMPNVAAERIAALLRRLLFVPEDRVAAGAADWLSTERSVEPKAYLVGAELRDDGLLSSLQRLTWLVRSLAWRLCSLPISS